MSISEKKLPLDFYLRNDVVQISKDLLGKELFTSFDKIITSGIIVETEAYAGISDKASHAYNNRKLSERIPCTFKEEFLMYTFVMGFIIFLML